MASPESLNGIYIYIGVRGFMTVETGCGEDSLQLLLIRKAKNGCDNLKKTTILSPKIHSNNLACIKKQLAYY